MTIAQQTATPAVAARPRHRAPIRRWKAPNPRIALVKIVGLVTLTALAGAVTAALAGLTFVMFVSSLRG